MPIEGNPANTESEANGTTAERQFDSLLLLTNLVNRADAGVLSSFALTLDDADQRTQVVREDGKVYTYAYDAIGQLTNAAASLPDGTPWPGYQFSYTYDATGNPIEQNKNGLVYSNSFNNLNQNVDSIPGGSLTVLGAANYPGGTATVNNVQAQMAPDGIFAASGVPFALGSNTLNWAFTDAFGRSTNRASSVTVSPKTFGYNLNGNMTNDSRFVYAWDCENRLVSVRDAQTGTLVQSNRYDALWRRREKIEYAPDGTAVTNRYIYKDWLVLAITDASGALLETYTHGTDLSGKVGGDAGGVGGILASAHNCGFVCYHYDSNGDIVNVSSHTETMLASYDYTPFGNILFQKGPFSSRYRFGTKEYDSCCAFLYYGYRHYAPSLTRWLSRDPIATIVYYNSFGRRMETNKENMANAERLPAYLFLHNNAIRKIDAVGLTDFLDSLECYLGEMFTLTWNVDDEALETEAKEFPGVVDPFDGDYRHCVAACILVRSHGTCLAAVALAYWDASESDPADSAAGWRGLRGAIFHPFTTCRELCKGLTVRPLKLH